MTKQKDLNDTKRCKKIAKHIQNLSVQFTCYDDFLNALDEKQINVTKEKLKILLSYVEERIRDIKAEEAFDTPGAFIPTPLPPTCDRCRALGHNSWNCPGED